jgi:RES domain-containing protein
VARPNPDAVVAARLADLEVRPWSGEVWRHMFADNPPEKRNVRGARWNPPEVEALYVSLDAQTALAEAEHLIESQPLRPIARRTLYRLQIALAAVVDLTGAGILSTLGVDEADTSSDDYRACQAVGAAASFLHLDGMIVPSARSPGNNIVVLFGGTRVAPTVEVLDSSTV